MRSASTGIAAVVCVLALNLGIHAATNQTQPTDQHTITGHLKREEYAGALEKIKAALAAQPNDAIMLYNAACASAQLGQLQQAEMYLRQAVTDGFLRFSHMKRDPDLDPLRGRPVYRALMQARQAADPVLAERRIKRWRERLTGADYQLHEDALPGIDVLTYLNQSQWNVARQRLSALRDDLRTMLFDDPMNWSLLITHPTQRDAANLFDNGHVRGNYRHEHRELITLDTHRSLRHEIIHAMHHAHMDRLRQQHPIWIIEGLACLFEQIDRDAEESIRFPADSRSAVARQLARQEDLIDWPAFFSMKEDEFLRSPREHYAQARSIMRFLAERNALREWYDVYTTQYESDSTGLRAIESVCDQPIEDIQRKWSDWLAQDNAPVIDSEPMVKSRRTENSARKPVTASNEGIAAKRDKARRRAEAQFNTLDASVRIGNYASLIEPLKKIVSIDPTFSAARYRLALAHLATGDKVAARRHHAALQDLDASLANLVANLLDR